MQEPAMPKLEMTVYYHRPWRTWVAYQIDAEGNQVGDAGYGRTREAARQDCEYQARSQQVDQ
jgi:hypothetical protein